MSRLINNARQLARCIVDVEWNQRTLSESLETTLDGGPPAPRQLAARLVLLGGVDRSPRFDRIIDILLNDKESMRRCLEKRHFLVLVHWI